MFDGMTYSERMHYLLGFTKTSPIILIGPVARVFARWRIAYLPT